MCKERWRTRDLLLEYDSNIMPPRPRAAGLGSVYPWEHMNLSILQKQIFQIAVNNGYQDDEESFWIRFAKGNIVFGTLDTFPIKGDEKTLYFDKDTESLYYFKYSKTIDENVAAIVGVAIVGRAIVGSDGTEEYALYIPLKAYLIENVILGIDGGTAADIID